jgi:hypothetical protein
MTIEEENNSMSEISVNSDKTDCDEMKIIKKSKITIVPLQMEHLHIILSKIFSEEEDLKENDRNYNEYSNNAGFFDKMIEIVNFQLINKINPPVRYHYMRRRVCYKLYKVFIILVIF